MAKSSTNQFFIADTSGLISLFSGTDSNHTRALSALSQPASFLVIIPSDVFAETVNTVGKRAGHTDALKLVRYLTENPGFTIVDSTQQNREAAIARFATQPESVSYTDCVVMAIADEYHTKHIFGFDAAFHKNGYSMVGE